MNIVIASGRLGKDPETRYTADGKPVTNFSVATDTGYGDKKGTTWFNGVAFGKTAELVQQYLTKGSEVTITGELRTEKYTSKDGEERTSQKLYVDKVKFHGGKKASAIDDDELDLSFD